MSPYYNYPDASKAVVVPLSEEQLARRLASEGGKVRMVHGRYWLEVLPGLYDGVHWLSRHTVEEVRKPASLCWGYRAALHHAESHGANGAIPMHLITDVEAYDISELPSRTRRELRQFQRNDVRIVHINRPDVFRDQGYEVMCSWLARTRHRAAAPVKRYLADAERNVLDPTRLVLAGMAGDKLLGYSTSWVVEGSVYIWEFHVSPEAFPLHLSTALWFETAQVYRRSGVAREICAGLAMPEKEGLTRYKNRLGFQLVRIPTRVWLLRLLSGYIRSRHPYQYYRFTGEEPRGVIDGDSSPHSEVDQAEESRQACNG
jgi:ribosomal protein S18 acetylase RimI-like enzyme